MRAVLFVMLSTICSFSSLVAAAPSIAPGSLLHEARQDSSDLEVSGAIQGLPPGATRFVSYRDLLRLPQVSFDLAADANFPRGAHLSGVDLDQLASALGAQPGSMPVAICEDQYRSTYPADYRKAHHPVLVLTVNRKEPGEWVRAEGGAKLGPYVISHSGFAPSFRILAHDDEAQVPFGVIRIDFRSEQQVFAAIAPPGTPATDSPVWQGYLIARQNCFRCHNSGSEGGHMAGRPWAVLSAWAAAEPSYFQAVVHNPQAVRPENHMPGNPGYDDATLKALTAYFASFSKVYR